jgi:hypothetical protein
VAVKVSKVEAASLVRDHNAAARVRKARVLYLLREVLAEERSEFAALSSALGRGVLVNVAPVDWSDTIAAARETFFDLEAALGDVRTAE